MNVSTKFYGFIGLVSTIGKNGFHISQRVSEFNKTVCHYAEQTFAKLKKTAAYSAKFNEKAKNKCHEWENWAEQKWEKAKKQEELNESWKELNEKFNASQPTSPSKLEQVQSLVVKKLSRPQTKIQTPEKAVYHPNCLRFLGIIV